MNDIQKKSLEKYLTQALLADKVEILQAALLSGGAVQENWALDLQVTGGVHGSTQGGRLNTVLRCDSPTAGVAISHGRAQEFALLQTVFNAGVTVPQPLCLCTDTSVFGRPFFVMRRIGGTAAGHVLVKNTTYAPDRIELANRLGRELARIHSIRPPQKALDFLHTYAESPAQYRINTHREFLDQHHTAYPALEWGLRWLERHAPARDLITLAHGDFRTGNYMVDEHGLTGILDWEFAGWSDPLEDIGWFCAKCWRFGQDDLPAGGIGEREHFYEGYEAESGRMIDRDQVHYWEVMAHVRWAVVAIEQAQRFCSGQENSLLLALTGHIVPELEWEILNMTEHN